MKEFIIASNNKNKIAELSGILSAFGFSTVSQSQAGCHFEVEETGTTFEENAYLKASAVVKATGLPAIADDSGLEVEALNGEPGIYSARYGPGHSATDRERYLYLLDKMKDKSNRRARFVCCICCVFPSGVNITVKGICSGEILYAPEGENGFGYDPVFKPDDAECSNACLTPEEKSLISHRGKALRLFKIELEKYLNDNN